MQGVEEVRFWLGESMGTESPGLKLHPSANKMESIEFLA